MCLIFEQFVKIDITRFLKLKNVKNYLKYNPGFIFTIISLIL